MAVQLNTGHSLYANLVALIGVEDDGTTIKDFKTPSRTFTENAAVTKGSGTWGRHFKTASNNSSDTTPKGVAISPTITLGGAPSGTGHSVFAVVNNVGSVGGNGSARGSFLGYSGSGNVGSIYAFSGTNVAYAAASSSVSSSTVTGTSNIRPTNGAHTVCGTFSSGSTSTITLYVDGSAQGTPTTYTKSTTASDGYVHCGNGANTSFSAEFVWVAIFNKVLTAQEVSDLHASLGANNQFALVQSAGASFSFAATNANDTAALSFQVSPIVGFATTNANDTSSLSFSSGNSMFSFTTTNGDDTASISFKSGGAFSLNATNGNDSSSLSFTGQIGLPTITSLPLKNNTASLLSGLSGITVFVHNVATGALILTKNNQATDGNGIISFSDNALTIGTTYRVIYKMASGAEGMQKVTAS